MNIDTQKIEQLLSENKMDEARDYIREIIKAPLSNIDKGEAIVMYTTMYMELMNNINEEYKTALEEILAGLKAVDVAESKLKEGIELKKVRAELNN